jgi:hypothetical protein
MTAEFLEYKCQENDTVIRIYPNKDEIWVGIDDGEWTIIGFYDIIAVVDVIADNMSTSDWSKLLVSTFHLGFKLNKEQP